MKKLFLFILVLIIVVAGGFYSASFGQNKEDLQAQLIDTSAPVEIQMEDSFRLDVDEWINEKFPTGSISGGQTPFKITSEGLPVGLKAKLDNRDIRFEGIPSEAGKFKVSISAIDSEGHSNLKNLNLTLKPVNLTSEKLLKERTNWLDKDREPSYEIIKTYDGFALLINWLLNSGNNS